MSLDIKPKIDVIVLNWNELAVTKQSIPRLLKEKYVDKIIIVDNGSTDGSKKHFNEIAGTVLRPNQDLIFKRGNRKILFIDWDKNVGSSVGRNMGLKVSYNEYVFLLDGDILYVKGSIPAFVDILKDNTDAVCVGNNSMEMIAKYGHNGTTNIVEADIFFDFNYTLSDWFPMAWTQYGLFLGDVLREIGFVVEPPFNTAGMGYEDDWLYQELNKRGWKILSVDKPLYYHEAHSGHLELKKLGQSTFEKERKELYEKRWGKKSSWIYTAITKEKTTRDKPQKHKIASLGLK